MVYHYKNCGIASHYLPIPRGGVKLLIMFTAVPVILSGAVLLVNPEHISVFGILAGTILLNMLIWSSLFDKDLLNWLSDYWNCNVVGKKADFNLNRGELWVDISSQGDKSGPGISIPLGGWFSKPRINLKVTGGLRITNYRIDDGYGHVTITLTDTIGDKVTLRVEQAIKFLTEIDYHAVHSSIVERLEEIETDWRYVAERRYLIIEGAIDAIQNTSRFGKSKEGKAIREALIQNLATTLTAHEPAGRREHLLLKLSPKPEKTGQVKASQ